MGGVSSQALSADVEGRGPHHGVGEAVQANRDPALHATEAECVGVDVGEQGVHENGHRDCNESFHASTPNSRNHSKSEM